MTNRPFKPNIIYEDRELIAINKPAGILSIPDRFNKGKVNLKDVLAKQFEDIFVVHRLDKETSGIILFAKNKTAHQSLSQQQQHRLMTKKYLAICYGTVSRSEGRIEMPIREMNNKRGKYQVHPNGKSAITLYKVLEKFNHCICMELSLITGRTHQIRVHLNAIDIPLLVDAVYGRSAAFYLSEIKGKKYKRAKNKVEMPLLSRCSLHAASLCFTHPGSRLKMELKAPLAKDLRACLNQLRKWDQRGYSSI